MNYTSTLQSALAFRRQRQPWNGLRPATSCVPLGGSAAGAQGGANV